MVGCLVLFNLPTEQPFSLHTAGLFGRDFVEFYCAAEELLAGRTPYYTWRYNKPPTVAYATIPLTALSMPHAAYVFFIAQLGALVAACWLALTAFFAPAKATRLELALLVGALVTLSYPAHFLLDRGNLDGFVTLFIAASAPLAMRMTAGNAWPGMAGGFLLACGVLTKLYPLALAGPLMIARRWWALAGATITCIVVVAATHEAWLEFARGIAWGRFGFVGGPAAENASLASTLEFLIHPFASNRAPTRGAALASYAVYGSSFAACMVMDARDRSRLDERASLLRLYLYVPFLIAMPKLSFHYSLVLLLPLGFALLWARLEARSSRTRRVVDAMLAGVLLSQFPSPAFQQIWNVPAAARIPGLGLLIVLLGALAYRSAGPDGR